MTTTPDDEYTPTTERVRGAAARHLREILPGDFDRWLAQHDADVREAVARVLTAIADASRTQAEVTTGLERAVLNGNARCFDTAADVARGAR